ncbi:three-deoxy-D-manno-octulosonic-acid transferase domain-containing protein [Actibacterium atlanticum]|uniref:3-deoxy-D-manno-octulosonic acid transferase n=1 Tax=Actibacterium atlanticum TaxID=1461693 RepID=A0A058ZL71_9RHOB|nr:glycosyltransferase N-terminal domain-containing protein [Actibacterium atlanticum]KCV82278.1 three-deoxy-D-manno-octulosonic-acid transferase domain-containing protein [Actibacterium atlanticum]
MIKGWLDTLRTRLAAVTSAVKSPAPETPTNTQRPDVPLIWVHDPTGRHSCEIDALFEHLSEIGAEQALLWTGPKGADPELAHFTQQSPPDTATAARAFLDHWMPAIALITAPDIPGALTAELQRRAVPSYLYQSDTHYKPPRNLLRRFNRYLVADQAVAGVLTRQGALGDRLSVIGTLYDGATPPPADEATRNQLAQALSARPSWLAAATTAAEDQIIVAAHAKAARRAHRLLLVLNPADPARGDELVKSLRREKWRVVQRSAGQTPDEETQILIADSPDELGLWFRIAPVSFMGGSLDAQGSGGIDPMGAAALGSAILHGPNLGLHASTYARLDTAQAARTVRDAQSLARLLDVFSAPEKAAELAHNAWQVSTIGAQATGRLADLILEEIHPEEDS